MNIRNLFLATFITVCWTINEPTNFDYSEHGGNWQNCPQNGSNQSPIDILENATTNGKSSNSYYFSDFKSSKATVNFLNTTIYINTSTNFGYSYTQLINGESVPFKGAEIRFRVHSEHKINHQYYPLQIQIFHTEAYPTSRNYKLAIGLLFDVQGNDENSFIQDVIDGYQNGQSASEITINLGKLLQRNMVDDFWYYLGSMTIPPCSNGKLNWLISKRVYSLNEEQYEKLKFIIGGGLVGWSGNWRQIQPLNGNKVGYRHLTPIENM